MQTRRDFLQHATAAGLAAAFSPPAGPKALPTSATRLTLAPGTVNTVRGPIDASKLGFTLPHEHVCVASAGFWVAWPEYFGGRAAFAKHAVTKLKELKAAGVDTIVDVTPIDVGRDVRLLEEVSRESGIHILTCTGHWLSPSLSMAARTADELAKFFTLEFERGIEGTGIKPAVIKVATDREGVTPFIENVLRAAARASKATGLPVTTHSYAAERGGEKQAAIFEAEGLDPSRVCIGHSDESNDLDYLTGLAKRGYTVGMDHFPTGARAIPGLLTWEQRADTLVRLVQAGFTQRLFLSNDWYFGLAIAPTGSMDVLEKAVPDGMQFVTRKVIPYLEQHGVSREQLRTITVDNPRRFFGGA